MAYSELLDHEITVHRSTETIDALRSVNRSWAVVATGQPMAVQTPGPNERFIEVRGGEMVTGRYLGFGEVDLDVEENDIIQVTGGADGWDNFGFLKVDSVSRPRGHHTEVRLTYTTEDPTL